MYGEKARSELHYCFEQILETTPHKTAAVQPLTSHLKNHLRRTRYARHCWRNQDELISDILLWTPIYEHTTVGWPARTYLHQLCADTGCILENLQRAMNRDGWGERTREIHAVSVTQWWWFTLSMQNVTQSQFLSRVLLVWIHFTLLLDWLLK